MKWLAGGGRGDGGAGWGVGGGGSGYLFSCPKGGKVSLSPNFLSLDRGGENFLVPIIKLPLIR